MNLTDRSRFALFALSAVLSLVIGCLLIPNGIIYYIFIYLGYPVIFSTFALFCASLYTFFRSQGSLKPLLPDNKLDYIIMAAAAGLLLTFEPFSYKIVFDEPILSTVAQMMHFDRLAGMPREANDYTGSYLLLNSFMDKRPLFFPFLLSLVHDLSGFRYENVFFLNAVLSLVLVLMLYMLGRTFGGSQGGRLSLLLTLTLPLLAIYTTSGHFEVLNLVMICLVVFLAYRFWDKPEETTLVPLVFALLLLFQVRYENCLYILPFGILILAGWKKAGRVLLPWQVLIAPALLILHVLQFRYILDESRGFFQEGPNGRDDTFAISYAQENLQSAWNFFFSAGQDHSNSYLLTVWGIAAIIVLLASGVEWLRNRRSINGPEAAMLCLLTAIGLYSIVLAFFNFGILDNYMTSRLALPLYLGFILASVRAYHLKPKAFLWTTVLFGLLMVMVTILTYPVDNFRPFIGQFLPVVLGYIGIVFVAQQYHEKRDRIITGFLLLFLLVVIMPIARTHRYSQDYRAKFMMSEQVEFIEKAKKTERILWISATPYPALLTQTNYSPIERFNANAELAARHLEDQVQNSIYLARVFKKNEQDQWELFHGDKEMLNESVFEFETVKEIPFEPGAILRIEKLVATNLEGLTKKQTPDD